MTTHFSRAAGLLVLFFGLWGCQNGFIQQEPHPDVFAGQSGHLTIEQAHHIYNCYVGRTKAGSGEGLPSGTPLHPGKLYNDWDYAATSLSGANSYVSVPSVATATYIAKSPRNAGWVKVVQKVVVVQEDATRKNNVYLLSIIPEGEYVKASPESIAEVCHGGKMPADFSGRVIYTKLRGGLTVYVGSYKDGGLEKDAFLFDKMYTFAENLEHMNGMLKGYRIEEQHAVTKSAGIIDTTGFPNPAPPTDPETGSGGDDWKFQIVGVSFWKDGYECWNATDSYGKEYIIADTDGDGQPDTVLDEDTDVGGESFPPISGGGGTVGGSIGGDTGGDTGGNSGGGSGGSSGGGGGTSGEGTVGGGDINPGENWCVHPKCPECGGCLSIMGWGCMPCFCFDLSLETSAHSVSLMQRYNLMVHMKPWVARSDNTSYSCVLEMLNDSGTWTPIAYGKCSREYGMCYQRIARVPDSWKVRARITYKDKTVLSNEVAVVELFPTYQEILANAALRAELDALWEETKQYANNERRREYGCWIFLDTKDGRYFCGATQYGPDIPPLQGTNASLPLTAPDSKYNHKGVLPTDQGIEYVAHFHTHTPLTYSYELSRKTGASQNDINLMGIHTCLGLVYDYVSNKKEGIISGHDINDLTTITPFGQARRTVAYQKDTIQ